jgi:UDP-N-acetylmuramoyl-L-alanyl-D-glutamate--2,6-diaminopimelate ligase
MQSALWQTLDQFLAGLPRPILQVTDDSRQVTAGSLFVAVTGGTFDGHHFIAQAIERGAVAVVGERQDLSLSLPYLVVPDARLALAYLSAHQQGYPARRLTMVGVTGTDGKTTTTNLIYHILRAAGIRAGMVSTVNAVLGQRVTDTGLHVTTPDAPAVQSYLSEMVQGGLTHCVLEATSHGLAQHRVSACEFDVAVITNITHEHLDYHGSTSAYRAAKAMLFEGLSSGFRKPGQPKVAVLNADDSSFDYLRVIPADQHITYSLSGPADLTARNLSLRPDGVRFELVTAGATFSIRSPLVGRYNVSNILGASAAALAVGLSPQAIQQGVAQLPGIPGRMELIKGDQDFVVMVDFAHTPNSLQRAIEAGRDMIGPEGHIITVFGSAGLRDVAKRQTMAQTSFRYADLTLLTAEDPRTESLDAILADMAAGCAAVGGVEGETFFRLPDRMEAIYFAFTRAQPGDLVLICGKGHEQSMCFGDTEYPWDDREAAHKALTAFLAGRPPPHSGLPTAD